MAPRVRLGDERGAWETVGTSGPVRSSVPTQESPNQYEGREQHGLNPSWRDEHRLRLSMSPQKVGHVKHRRSPRGAAVHHVECRRKKAVQIDGRPYEAIK